jgi:hypothetical protein
MTDPSGRWSSVSSAAAVDIVFCVAVGHLFAGFPCGGGKDTGGPAQKTMGLHRDENGALNGPSPRNMDSSAGQMSWSWRLRLFSNPNHFSFSLPIQLYYQHLL